MRNNLYCVVHAYLQRLTLSREMLLYVCYCFAGAFVRVYPYLCRAVRNFVTDHSQTPGLPAKEYYVSFTDISRRLKYDFLIFM